MYSLQIVNHEGEVLTDADLTDTEAFIASRMIADLHTHGKAESSVKSDLTRVFDYNSL